MAAPSRALFALAIGIEAFLGLGALVPGWALMSDPSGASLGLQKAWLSSSPFADFRVPGAFLFGAIGLGNLGLVLMGWRRRAMVAAGACAMGLFIMAWIGSQALWLAQSSWLQPFILVLGMALAAAGWALYRQQRRL